MSVCRSPDAHDLDNLVPILENIRDNVPLTKPVLLHIKSTKGKGYPPAEAASDKVLTLSIHRSTHPLTPPIDTPTSADETRLSIPLISLSTLLITLSIPIISLVITLSNTNNPSLNTTVISQYHGVAKFDVASGKQKSSPAKTMSFTNVFANSLIAIAETDPKVKDN